MSSSKINYSNSGSLQTAWKHLIGMVIKRGEEVLDERGSKTLEVRDVIWRVLHPEFSKYPDAYPLKKGGKAYEDQFLNPDRKGFVYTYGNRLRNHFVAMVGDGDDLMSSVSYVDQVQLTIDRLNNNPNSRRATMVTFDPSLDSFVDEIPCCILIDCKVRGDNELNISALWRSHDLYGAVPTNFMALKKLQEYIAKETNTRIGTITVHSISLHIYEHDWESAKRVLK